MSRWPIGHFIRGHAITSVTLSSSSVRAMCSHVASTLSFYLADPELARFHPRVGIATLERADLPQSTVQVQTPALITSTSRGLVPHFTRDHHSSSDAVRWIGLPFESFLDRNPPLPTLFKADRPLHDLLGFAPQRNVLVMSLRDPADGREMPANANDAANASCVRGVRKVTTEYWSELVHATKPDVVIALSDTPYTPAPHSFKRVTKSVERSLAWLSTILRPIAPPAGQPMDNPSSKHPLSVFVHMAGGASERPRTVFAEGLMETLYHQEAEAIAPLKTLDEGVAGYVFDLVPIRTCIHAENGPVSPTPSAMSAASVGSKLAPDLTSRTVPLSTLVPLLQASLEPLPSTKPRVVHSCQSPHEMLGLVEEVGVDFFDAWWAQRTADIGVALDFVFPAPPIPEGEVRSIGHNLYDDRYTNDFSQFASSLLAGHSASHNASSDQLVCPCVACSPMSPASVLSHSKTDPPPPGPTLQPPFTRGYVHHLLHTHEMSAHTLLVAHNLAVLDAFLEGVRRVLTADPSGARFRTEVARFREVYDEGVELYATAVRDWGEVELARGKGRLAREKAKQDESTLSTVVEL